MYKRIIKKQLKKNKLLRKFGWWFEVKILSQILKEVDLFESTHEVMKRKLGKKPSVNDQALIALKGSKQMESCIIVGNGPSLCIADLDAIHKSGIASFGLNKINQIYNKTEWRPDYIVVHDHRFLISGESTIDIRKYISEIQDKRTKIVFFRRQISKCFDAKLSTKILYFRMALKSENQIEATPIKGDISLQIEDLGTVTATAIEIALYMGFSKIYLYGQDFKYKKYIDIDGAYIDDDDANTYAPGIQEKVETYKSDYHDLRKAFLGFKQCKEFAESRGVVIYNATRGGNLNVFDRVEFEDVFFGQK